MFKRKKPDNGYEHHLYDLLAEQQERQARQVPCLQSNLSATLAATLSYPAEMESFARSKIADAKINLDRAMDKEIHRLASEIEIQARVSGYQPGPEPGSWEWMPPPPDPGRVSQ